MAIPKPAPRLLGCTLALCLGAAGCMFQNLSATQRFSESAFVLNDAARWGRLDVARGYVDASYAERYAARHRGWGGPLQIAEADIVSMQLDDEKDTATSRVQVSWYSTDTMSLHASVIVQSWKASGQDFLLTDEELEGDAALFGPDAVAPATDAEPASSGDETTFGGHVPEAMPAPAG